MNNDDINDDVHYHGCPYIEIVKAARTKNDAYFADYEWMIEKTREPIKAMYGLDDEYIDSLVFHSYFRMTDTATALDFEGYPYKKKYFSDAEWELSHKF